MTHPIRRVTRRYAIASKFALVGPIGSWVCSATCCCISFFYLFMFEIGNAHCAVQCNVRCRVKISKSCLVSVVAHQGIYKELIMDLWNPLSVFFPYMIISNSNFFYWKDDIFHCICGETKDIFFTFYLFCFVCFHRTHVWSVPDLIIKMVCRTCVNALYC